MAFQRAVEACAASGGGMVEVPPGRFVTGTIALKSNVYLRLAPGAVILGSEDIRDYTGTTRGCAFVRVFVNSEREEKHTPDPCVALIVADRCENCGIVGRGIIDGQRNSLLGHTPEKGKPYLVVFSECGHVCMEGVTLQNPGIYCSYFLNCSGVKIRGVDVHSENSMCGDGFDFDGGRDVAISDCLVSAGDDGISIKSFCPKEPCENFTITNCTFRCKWWGGIRIGPESAASMRNIAVSNCVFEDCGDGVKLQLCEGGNYEHFTFTGLVMNRVVRPILVTVSPFRFSFHSPVLPQPGSLRHIRFNNIVASHEQRQPGERVLTVFEVEKPHQSINFLYALPGTVVEDFTISNSTFLVPGGGREQEGQRGDYQELIDYCDAYPEMLLELGRFPAAGMFVRHFGELSLHNVTFCAENPDGRCAIAADDVERLNLWGVAAKGTAGLCRTLACGEVRQALCEGKVLEAGETAKKQYEAEQAAAGGAIKQLDAMAALAGQAEMWPEVVSFSEREAARGVSFCCSGKGRLVLVCAGMKGRFRLLVNGQKAGQKDMAEQYDFLAYVAFDVTEFIKEGENTLQIQADGPLKTWGSISLRQQ